MTRSAAFIPDDPKKTYWGSKMERIDLEKDELGNWRSNGVLFTYFNAGHVPLLLLRFIPYCPECLETCFDGLNSWEKYEGQQGIAFRHTYHFWYQGKQCWGWPPKETMQVAAYPVRQSLDAPNTAYAEGHESYLLGVTVWKNPYDGRTADGKAWLLGWNDASAKVAGVSSEG